MLGVARLRLPAHGRALTINNYHQQSPVPNTAALRADVMRSMLSNEVRVEACLSTNSTAEIFCKIFQIHVRKEPVPPSPQNHPPVRIPS